MGHPWVTEDAIGQTHIEYKGCCVVFCNLIQISSLHSVSKRCRINQTLHSVASGLILDCLPIYIYNKLDARRLLVNIRKLELSKRLKLQHNSQNSQYAFRI